MTTSILAVAARFRVGRLMVPVLSIVCGLGLWQLLVSVFHPNDLAVVGPLEVARAAGHLTQSGVLGADVRLSVFQLAVGLVIGIVTGAATGLLLGTVRWVAAFLGPWVTALYTIPVIAVTPLIIVALGFGDTAKILIVAASAYFPIAINTQAGATQVMAGPLRDVAWAFRAGRFETFRDVTLPGTVPFILVGIRLAIGRALIALVAADLFGSTSGIGYLILSGQQNLNTANVYVGVVTLSVLGIGLTGAVAVIEHRVNSARIGRTA